MHVVDGKPRAVPAGGTRGRSVSRRPTVKLGFRRDFDPALLSWGGPDEPAAEECSICEAAFDEDDVPLIMWREDGWCVRLCDACVERWIEAKP
jgi:hypothetical protein